jgi:hypothetical protein
MMTALMSRVSVVIEETCKSERVIGYPRFSRSQGGTDERSLFEV